MLNFLFVFFTDFPAVFLPVTAISYTTFYWKLLLVTVCIALISSYALIITKSFELASLLSRTRDLLSSAEIFGIGAHIAACGKIGEWKI